MNMRIGIAAVALCAAGIAYFQLRDAGADATWKVYAPDTDGDVRLIVFGAKPEDDAELSEGLYDWADYLNDFKSDHPEVEITFEPVETCKALLDHKGCDRSYPSLFLNKDGEALFYPRAIVEPQVYVHAHAKLSGAEIPDYAVPYTSEAVTLK